MDTLNSKKSVWKLSKTWNFFIYMLKSEIVWTSLRKTLQKTFEYAKLLMRKTTV